MKIKLKNNQENKNRESLLLDLHTGNVKEVPESNDHWHQMETQNCRNNWWADTTANVLVNTKYYFIGYLLFKKIYGNVKQIW